MKQNVKLVVVFPILIMLVAGVFCSYALSEASPKKSPPPDAVIKIATTNDYTGPWAVATSEQSYGFREYVRYRNKVLGE